MNVETTRAILLIIATLTMSAHIWTRPSVKDNAPEAILSTLTDLFYFGSVAITLWAIGKDAFLAIIGIAGLITFTAHLVMVSVPRARTILKGERVLI